MKHFIKYLTTTVIVLFTCSFQSDKGKVLLVRTHDFFSVDNLGNCYVIKDGEIIKYLSNGKYFTRYSNKKLGTITSVDATNALRIMLFYKDQQQLVFLDNQLSQKNDAVSLEAMGLEQTDLACMSANNGFWAYNKANNELMRFDEHLNKLVATGNLKQILQMEIEPSYMMEHNNRLYLNCPETGILIFDIFGTYSKTVPLKQLRQFQVDEHIFYYQRDSTFCSYDSRIFEQVCNKLPVSGIKQSFYSKTKVYLSDKDTLFVY